MEVKFYVNTNKVGSEVEETLFIEEDEIEDMSESEINDYIHDMYKDWLPNNIEQGWEII